MESDQNWRVSYIVSKNKTNAVTEHSSRAAYNKAPAPKTNKKMPGKAPHLVDDDIMKGRLDLNSFVC